MPGRFVRIEREYMHVVVARPSCDFLCGRQPAFFWLRQASTVVAPSVATPTAVSFPMPSLLPVMTTTLPCMPMTDLLSEGYDVA